MISCPILICVLPWWTPEPSSGITLACIKTRHQTTTGTYSQTFSVKTFMKGCIVWSWCTVGIIRRILSAPGRVGQEAQKPRGAPRREPPHKFRFDSCALCVQGFQFSIKYFLISQEWWWNDNAKSEQPLSDAPHYVWQYFAVTNHTYAN